LRGEPVSVFSHKITVGDTRTPLGVNLVKGSRPVDLASRTVKVEIYPAGSDTATVVETATGVTSHPTQTFTLDSTNKWLYAVDHKAEIGQQVVLSTTGNFTSTGVAAATRYFVIEATPNTFKLSLTPNGPAIDITGAGSGTHSFYIVGSVSYEFSDAAVAVAGSYRLWFSVHDADADFEHFPNDENGITIEIKAVP
jgi:hypothetical protein